MEIKPNLLRYFVITVIILATQIILWSCLYHSAYENGRTSRNIGFKRVEKLIKATDKGSIAKSDFDISVQNERIAALNKRFDDLFILGGIIITLIVVLIAGIYIKTDHEVKKHMDDNFTLHKNKISELVVEATSLVESIRYQQSLTASAPPQTNDNEGGINGNE